MILTNTENSIDVDGGSLTQLFGMDQNSLPVIFDILRNRMYSDPIASICREIACNSRDANREAGNGNLPIKITLVKDFLVEGVSKIIFSDSGKGMSPEVITEVYTKYGASTKRETNDLTGGFGLGSKTPFAYTDTFFVDTRVDGILYKYMVYIDETGLGAVTLMVEQATDEKNGTDITIPLKKEHDAVAFSKAVSYYTMFWDVQPELHGEFTNNSVAVRQCITKEPNSNLLFLTQTSENIYLDIGTSYLIVDGIPYRIDKEKFKYNFGCIKFIENGIVTLAGTRENLQYDKKTNDFFRAWETELNHEIKANAISDINKFLSENNYHKILEYYLTRYSEEAKKTILYDIFETEFPELNDEITIILSKKIYKLNFHYSGARWDSSNSKTFFTKNLRKKKVVLTYYFDKYNGPRKSRIVEAVYELYYIDLYTTPHPLDMIKILSKYFPGIIETHQFYRELKKKENAKNNIKTNKLITPGYSKLQLIDIFGKSYTYKYKIKTGIGELYDKGNKVEYTKIVFVNGFTNSFSKTKFGFKKLFKNIENDIIYINGDVTARGQDYNEFKKYNRIKDLNVNICISEFIKKLDLDDFFTDYNYLWLLREYQDLKHYFDNTILIDIEYEKAVNKFGIDTIEINNSFEYYNSIFRIISYKLESVFKIQVDKHYDYKRNHNIDSKLKSLSEKYNIFNLVITKTHKILFSIDTKEKVEILNKYLKLELK